MIARALAWLLLKTAGKEEREMLVRLYAGEIIMGRITEDDVPAKLKARVHKYLVDMATSTTSRSKPNKQGGPRPAALRLL